MGKLDGLQLPPSLTPEASDAQGLRLLSRSPHPYHHLNNELLHPADRIAYNGSSLYRRRLVKEASGRAAQLLSPGNSFSKESSFGSDSATEADDEAVLKSLPAPRTRLHKGLRGQNEALSGSSTPLFAPPIAQHHVAELGEKLASTQAEWRLSAERVRRNRNLLRRFLEVGILVTLGLTVISTHEVQLSLKLWSREILASISLLVLLVSMYPVRVVLWTYRQRESQKWIPLNVPIDFDPAPILYPHAITMLTTFLLAPNNPAIILPNLILSISSLPEELIPGTVAPEAFNPVHWLLSYLPLVCATSAEPPYAENAGMGSIFDSRSVSTGVAVLLYPLHRTLCKVLNYLTTTSLLPAELQLFSIALINILLLSTSPQLRILKALLWIGGLSAVVSCGPVIPWGIALARVPKWRFRRPGIRPSHQLVSKPVKLFTWARLKLELNKTTSSKGHFFDGWSSSDEELDDIFPLSPRATSLATNGNDVFAAGTVPTTPLDDAKDPRTAIGFPPLRRHTLPVTSNRSEQAVTHTPGGRRKRATSKTIRAFFKLTEAEAEIRKWLYASWVYGCLLAVIFAGIRLYITKFALGGNEAIGWALGYLFGDLNWFRFTVVKENLDRWICLPPRYTAEEAVASCQLGWVQHVRKADFGEANMRLVIGAYWVMILIFGLIVVYRLRDIYEVDTRRKVFHFMMVAMFLPATYIDPAFAALALAVVLAGFLILDLLRASQLPPLSKPITYFLAPYVDGRDFQGPVVISHIFLLIGCAIPLWLTLGSLPRAGTGYLAGWEIPTKEVSMVSGVVCVGLGDAAASLIGRRWGRRKWLWKGGKSLEGSLAFAIAVFSGLVISSLWLRIGRWAVSPGQAVWWRVSHRNAAVCASMASLTEAVLTGGNDNVIVPVVLWACVKSLGV